MVDEQVNVPANKPLIGLVLLTTGLVAAPTADLVKEDDTIASVDEWWNHAAVEI